MKKITSLLLSLVLICMLVTPSFAMGNSESAELRPSFTKDAVTGDYSESDKLTIDQDLLNRGFPLDVLDKMSYDSKEIFYCDPSIEYAGSFDINLNDSDISCSSIYEPNGQIPDNNLTLTFTFGTSQIPDSNNRLYLNNVRVTYDYNWTDLPFFRGQDPVSVSWDKSKFGIRDGSFYKIDQYRWRDTNNGLTGTDTKSSAYNYANGGENGISWYADLEGYSGGTLMPVVALFGHGTFILDTKYKMYSGSSTIFGHYVHPTVSTGATVTIPHLGDFSVSCGGGYDEMAGQRTLSW